MSEFSIDENDIKIWTNDDRAKCAWVEYQPFIGEISIEPKIESDEWGFAMKKKILDGLKALEENKDLKMKIFHLENHRDNLLDIKDRIDKKLKYYEEILPLQAGTEDKRYVKSLIDLLKSFYTGD